MRGMLDKDFVISEIKRMCLEKDFTFKGFVGEYIGTKTKLILKCNKCGTEWMTTTYNNLKKDRKSHSCGRKNPLKVPVKYKINSATSKIIKKTQNSSLEFISFDKNGYVGANKTKVVLRCNKCGKINIRPYSGIINGRVRCDDCERSGKFSNEHAVKLIKRKCDNLNYTFCGFDAVNNRYHGKKTYLVLKCNKCGYIWKTTTFASFMQNVIKCPNCINSWKMEKEIESCLNENKIGFIPHCRNNILPWLTNKISLSLDFYLPEYNTAIECQGRQHFEPVNDFGGEKSFQESIERDKKKLKLCKENGVRLLYYDSEHGHKEFLNEKVYNDKEAIIEKINTYEQENKNFGNSK